MSGYTGGIGYTPIGKQSGGGTGTITGAVEPLYVTGTARSSGVRTINANGSSALVDTVDVTVAPVTIQPSVGITSGTISGTITDVFYSIVKV